MFVSQNNLPITPNKMKQFLIVVAMCCSMLAFGQNYSFRVYDTKDGIQNADMLCLISDSRGFIWLGGHDGITRFDGHSFVNYNKVNNGLIDNTVIGITEDYNHNLWLATKRGVSCFNGRSFTNYIIPDTSDLPIYVRNIYETKDHQIYACCSKGLFVLRDNKFIQVSKEINFNVKGVIEYNGSLWLATSKGLYEITKEKKINVVQVDTNKATNNITCIKIYNGIIWIGTTKGIVKYDGKSFKKYSNDKISDITMMPDKNILSSSFAQELNIYDKKTDTFDSISIKSALPYGDLLRVMVDSNKNVWMASAAGLIKMYRKPFNKSRLYDSLKSPVFSAIQNKKVLLFATQTGVLEYKNGKFKSIKTGNDQFTISLFDADSCIYIGTYSGQVYKYQNGSVYKFGETDYSSSQNAVYYITSDKKGGLWICKNYNVIHYTNNEFKKNDFSAPQSNTTRMALVDNNHNSWFTNYLRLTEIDSKGNVISFSKQQLNSDSYTSIVKDNAGNLWIGTSGNGIAKYDGKNFKSYTVADGLCNNFIQSELYDSTTNTLWAGTINGLNKIMLSNMSIKVYNSEQGIDNSGCLENGLFFLDNKITMSTADGLYQYDEALDHKISNAPMINFIGIRINYETPSWDEGQKVDDWSNLPVDLKLPYNKNHVTFDFTGINLDAPENVSYQWMMEGFDRQYNPVSKNTSATYSNLPAGNYTFKLRSYGSKGNWNERAYSFTVVPPLWATWWFILLCVLLVIAVSWLLINHRIKQIRMIEFEKINNIKKITESELKAMRAQMNPHFMFNALSSIQDVIMTKDEENAIIHLTDFARLMRLILENSTQKTITLQDELEFILLYLNLEEIRFNNKYKVKVNVAKDISTEDIFIPPMLIQPYIENAIIHGLIHKDSEGLLELDFSITEDRNRPFLTCTVTDNGIGRKQSASFSEFKLKPHRSMGMDITAYRIEMLNNINRGFSIQINDLNQGTRVEITIPLN
ncbi:MAG: hypothetical protein JWO44_624 [Bacteroidetes bacterium]|nr:hypothetical protein [Bacteroidota bacterium]